MTDRVSTPADGLPVEPPESPSDDARRSSPVTGPPSVTGSLHRASAVPPARELRGGVLTDRGAVVLAAAVASGAWWHEPLPLWLGVVAVVVALAVRRPWLLVAGGFVLATALGERAWAGLDPMSPAPFAGTVTLLADPTATPYGVRVDVRVGERRVELDASDAAGGTVGQALAGERLVVTGRLRPPPADAPWLVPRHVVGRLAVERAERLDGGAAPGRAANRFRRLLGRGAEVLPEAHRSLYGGFVLGDDRNQPPELVDDFRAAGLTHLLVVSGQNVAFVLVLVSPLTGRLRLGGRWAVTVAVIGAFGVVTRFEPSVLRASAMAALAVTAVLAGRPTGTLRVLALAVSGLVLVDPLLVHSVGFQLSVAASLGIAVLGPPITTHLRGPPWWREALGVTLAAQLGVAPVLVPRFGGVPVVSIAANVAAVPVAGLVTTWGLPAGVIAGLGGPAVAHLVHLPTRLLIGWVAAVARVAAGVPLGELAAPGLMLAVAGGGAAVVLARHRPTWRAARIVALGAVAVALFAPAVALRSPPLEVQAAPGVAVYRAGGATVVVLDADPGAKVLLEGLRLAGVRRIDVLVSEHEPSPDVVRALRHRWPVTRLLATTAPIRLAVGGLVVDVVEPGEVSVAPDRSASS